LWFKILLGISASPSFGGNSAPTDFTMLGDNLLSHGENRGFESPRERQEDQVLSDYKLGCVQVVSKIAGGDGLDFCAI
jgi:hypothetical protein